MPNHRSPRPSPRLPNPSQRPIQRRSHLPLSQAHQCHPGNAAWGELLAGLHAVQHAGAAARRVLCLAQLH